MLRRPPRSTRTDTLFPYTTLFRLHILLVEEVSEYRYAFDRVFFHVTSVLAGRGLAGLRLGRVSDVPENDRPFGIEAEAIARYWCERNGIPWLGRADIGHDGDTKVVRSDERRVGNESVRTGKIRGAPYH